MHGVVSAVLGWQEGEARSPPHTHTLRVWLLFTCEKKAYLNLSCEAKERSDLASSSLLFFSSSCLLTCGLSVRLLSNTPRALTCDLEHMARTNDHNLLCMTLLKGVVFYNFVQGEKISILRRVGEQWKSEKFNSQTTVLNYFINNFSLFFYQATGYRHTLMVYVTKHKYNKVSAAIYTNCTCYIVFMDRSKSNSQYICQNKCHLFHNLVPDQFNGYIIRLKS